MTKSGDTPDIDELLEKAQGKTLEKLSEREVAEHLESRGYIVTKPRPRTTVLDFDRALLKGKDRVRLAVVSDTHFGSIWQQPSYLHEFYRYAEEEAEVDAFIHCGDVTDGHPEMHKGALYGIFHHGYAATKRYVIDTYPTPQGRKRKTYLIGGNHDESWYKNGGADIVEDICDHRDDMEYLGDQRAAYMDFGKVRVLLAHPYIAGNTITLSRPAQRLIEQMSPELKPHLMFIGNFHKPFYLPSYRNVDAFLLPAFQATTDWMRGKGYISIIGAWIVEFGTDPAGLAASLKTERIIRFKPIPDDHPASG